MATSAARAKQLIPRPTGLTRDEYRGHEKWSYRRWAWEFLRRNQEFIRACRESRGDPERQAQVATEFGLKRFKPYTEGFTTNKRPMFSAASVDSWSALDAEEVRVVRPRLRQGQVLVRFNLAAARDDALAIDAQLAAAQRRLKALQRRYMQAVGADEPPAHERKPMYFLRGLRLLDLLDGRVAQHREPGHALRLVNEPRDTKKPMSDAEALKEHRKQIAQARELCSQGYRHLATRAGKPTAKRFA